jgi:hypothetical protein
MKYIQVLRIPGVMSTYVGPRCPVTNSTGRYIRAQSRPYKRTKTKQRTAVRLGRNSVNNMGYARCQSSTPLFFRCRMH